MAFPDRVEIATLEKKLATAEQQIRDQEKRLSLTLRALHALRHQRRVVLKTAAPRAARAGDIVRVILNDVHGAKMDRAAVAAALADVARLHPDQIILNGDIVDCGGFLAQHHTLGYVAQTDYSYEQDCAYANGFLDSLRKAAPSAKIEYIEGNHERRVETWCVTETLRSQKDSELLRQALAPEFMLNLKNREIPYYRQGQCYDGLNIPGVIKRGKIFYLHGISTARNASAATLAKVAGNVVFAHTHRAQSDILRPMNSGVIGAWNPGCLCELQPLWQHTNPTDWTSGYAVEFVSRTGSFLHINIPIINGVSHLTELLGR